jgi:hypothetical protein
VPTDDGLLPPDKNGQGQRKRFRIHPFNNLDEEPGVKHAAHHLGRKIRLVASANVLYFENMGTKQIKQMGNKWGRRDLLIKKSLTGFFCFGFNKRISGVFLFFLFI